MIKKHTHRGGRHGDSRGTLYVWLIFLGLFLFAAAIAFLSTVAPH